MTQKIEDNLLNNISWEDFNVLPNSMRDIINKESKRYLMIKKYLKDGSRSGKKILEHHSKYVTMEREMFHKIIIDMVGLFREFNSNLSRFKKF